MIESGHRSPSRDFAGRCDEAFGTPRTFARLEKRLRDAPFSSGFRPFQPYENQAVSLRLFEHTLIPCPDAESCAHPWAFRPIHLSVILR
jgi:hypothetical protein